MGEMGKFWFCLGKKIGQDPAALQEMLMKDMGLDCEAADGDDDDKEDEEKPGAQGPGSRAAAAMANVNRILGLPN